MDVAHLVRAMTGMRWAPLHFLLLGGALFLLQAFWFAPADGGDPLDFVIDTQALVSRPVASGVPLPTLIDDEILYREALRQQLDRGDAVIYQRLVRNMQFLDPEGTRDHDELYRAALDLGLDKTDVVVRRRLIERMRRRLLENAAIARPTDEELVSYLEAHAARFDKAPRVRLSHRFFDDPEVADQVARDVALGKLDGDAVQGDAFPISERLPSLSERELSARLGPDFAQRVLSLPPGSWQGPVESAYGFHLVRVDEASEGRPAALDEVRARVAGDWLAEQEAAALESALQALRPRYSVVDDGADSGGEGSSIR